MAEGHYCTAWFVTITCKNLPKRGGVYGYGKKIYHLYILHVWFFRSKFLQSVLV